LAKKDKDGYFWFIGRKDDLIISSGYRIGPNEIENCLLKHPAFNLVAVVGVPDKIRGEVVKTYIVLNDLFKPDEKTKKDLQNFVKLKLVAYEYPRIISFVGEIPLIVIGKIKRKFLKNKGDEAE